MMASNDCLDNYLLACYLISSSYDQNFQKYYQKRQYMYLMKNGEKLTGILTKVFVPQPLVVFIAENGVK